MIGIALGMGIFGLFLSAFSSGSETGFYRATRLRLVLDAMAGDRIARGLLFLTNHPALFVATALVGNSVANYLISLATVIVMDQVFPQFPEGAEIVASIALAPVVLVYGELLPKNLFLQAPNRLLRRGGTLFLFFVVLFFPLAGLLWLLGQLLARVTRSSHEPVRLVLAQRELRRILAEGHEAGILHPAQQSLAHGILAVARKPVRQFLTLPGPMVQVRADMGKEAVLRLAEHSHTPVIPVAADASGRLVGYVRVVDLRLHEGDDLAPIRPLPEIRDDSSHLAALMRLESTGDSLARVINVRGETVGIVTLERLREPLF
ncbi:MAG: CNNM domain-containing protein [Thermoguttaceae bacterium]|jgi:CBS domain containing-hemolysin-like protein